MESTPTLQSIILDSLQIPSMTRNANANDKLLVLLVVVKYMMHKEIIVIFMFLAI